MVERVKNRKNVRTTRDRWLVLGMVCAAVLLATGVVTTWILASKMEKPADPVAPGFVLRDQQGRLTSLAQFRGKVVLLTFIDPECTQLCPLTTQSMVQAVNLLGPAGAQVQLLGVDANPQKTRVADVADYTNTHGLQGRWRFLTGMPAQLERVWKSYGVYVAVVHNDIQHTAVVVLIDKDGNEHDFYSTPMKYGAVSDQAEQLAQGIAELLPGHPPVSTLGGAPEQSEGPSQQKGTMSFIALGPKRQSVDLGSSHSHLVVFFAGWLGQDSNLSKDLNALNGYAALARQRGWPSPVAVDELTTEPSPAEALRVLDPLAATLHAPIIEDASGRLADDYLVEDLPWFVLTSSSGKILWHHDGWLPAAALDQQVRAVLPHS